MTLAGFWSWLYRVLAPERFEALLRQAFPDAEIELRDLTGGADHYELRLASARFVGAERMARHRMVHAALTEQLRGDVHALTLRLYTPEEWRERD